jgi:rubrerythrin
MGFSDVTSDNRVVRGHVGPAIVCRTCGVDTPLAELVGRSIEDEACPICGAPFIPRDA